MKKEKKYMGLTQNEMEVLFKKLNCYGLGLLSDTVEALQFNYDEDGELLKNAYNNAYAQREVEEGLNTQELNVKKAILRKSLKKLNKKELIFLKNVLDTDPIDVFNNPYSRNNDYNSIIENDCHYEMSVYVNDETYKRSLNKKLK